MKKIILTILIIILLFINISCDKDDSYMECGMIFDFLNLSDSTYYVHHAFDVGEVSLIFDESISGRVDELLPGKEIGTGGGIPWYRSDEIDKIIGMLTIKNEKGEIIYRACGWPESWKTNPPEGWTIPKEDYDRYGIGYVDRTLNNNIDVYYINDEGVLKHEYAGAIYCVIKEDGTVETSDYYKFFDQFK